jgi:hypothetical protein
MSGAHPSVIADLVEGVLLAKLTFQSAGYWKVIGYSGEENVFQPAVLTVISASFCRGSGPAVCEGVGVEVAAGGAGTALSPGEIGTSHKTVALSAATARPAPTQRLVTLNDVW